MSSRAAWTCDDAFISYRYALNLVEGKGLVFNAGERVEGYSNFLWTLWCAVGLLLKVSGWYRQWDKTANAATAASNVHISNLLRGYVGHLAQGRVGVLDPPDPQTQKTGVCGTLRRYLPEGIEA